MSSRRSIVLVSILSAVAACKGDAGPTGSQGSQGDPGSAGSAGSAAATTGTLGGVVTDGVAHDALAGVTVAASDEGGTPLATATTDATGKFAVTVTAGPVELTFAKPDYTSPGVLQSGVGIGQTVQVAVAMSESATGKPSLVLAAPAPGDDFGFGATIALTAVAADPNGDALAYAWAGTSDPVLDGSVVGTGATAAATLPSLTAALSPRTTSSGMTISGYALENRFGVLPIMTDTRGQMTAQVTVSDGRGQSASAALTLDAASIVGNLHAVSVGQLVYVNSGHDGSNAWTFTPPPGSTATISDATVRTPAFRPDVAGPYALCEGATCTTLYAGSYYGMIGTALNYAENPGEPDGACLSCHLNLGTIPDRFVAYANPFNPAITKTGWVGTAHATAFADGIDGQLESHFNGSCAGCHSTADDLGVANGGFDDVAAAADWTFPGTLAPTNWQTMLDTAPTVARLANVQCEACHGPQTDPIPLQKLNGQFINAHGQTEVVVNGVATSHPFQSPRISYGAEVCGTCHAAGGDHIYTEWATASDILGSETGVGMAHSNRVAPTMLGLTTSKGVTSLNTSCARCHTAQGYTLYAELLTAAPSSVVTLTATCGSASGNACDPRLPTATVLGEVTAANAEPVTCQSCHDPHDATNPSQLRIYDRIAMLPSGFGVSGMGKGALCVSCHNSRNGTTSASDTATFLHEDAQSGGVAPVSYSAPHLADQGDVFEGRNAYFMGGSLPMNSKHAAITDTCVGCHMTLQPASLLSFGQPAHESHLFRITDDNQQQLCANCHGSQVDGKGVQAGLRGELAQLQTAVNADVQGRIAAVGGVINVIAYDDAGDASKSFAITTATTPIARIVFAGDDIHGQISLDVTLATPITIQYFDANGNALAPVTTTTFAMQLGSLKDNQATPATLFAVTGDFTKAGWNAFLIQGDQSWGLHNPTFATAVLNTTLSVLDTDVATKNFN